jgi:hypothetical protein
LQLIPSIWEKLRLIVTSINQRQSQWDWLPPLPSLSELVEQLQSLSTPLFQNFFALFSNSFTAIGQFILVILLTLMMLVSPQSYRCRALQLIPSFYRRRTDEILMLCEVVDERMRLRAMLLQDQTLWRERRALREVDRQIITLLGQIGFTPSERGLLGTGETNKNDFSDLHKRIAEKRSASR